MTAVVGIMVPVIPECDWKANGSSADINLNHDTNSSWTREFSSAFA